MPNAAVEHDRACTAFGAVTSYTQHHQLMRITPLLFCLLIACGPSKQPQGNDDLPKALQEPSFGGKLEGSYSRGYKEDLVDVLFEHVLKQDAELAALVKDLDRQATLHADSMRTMLRFEERVQEYYRDARGHVAQLSDSLEGTAQLKLLEESEARYNERMTALRELRAKYQQKRLRNDDLLTLVKLGRTRAIMERYQQEQLPAAATLEGELARITALQERLEKALAK